MAASSSQQQQTHIHTNSQDENQETNIVFNRFGLVSDPSDHYYAKNRVTVSPNTNKKIMQEWKILEKHLPDSIYVRAYENRTELLRAVIIGPTGTPYHDGLYFFDIALPADYPNQPPSVRYRSFGLRINPNLYANGLVCLSLLNTWPGQKCERWNPKESTLLQVLVSIQALVLNEKPYYNEPGTGISVKNSNSYSDTVFFLSCKTMLCLLRNPPNNFEDFVAVHFRERANTILSACSAYVNGHVRVGYYKNDASCTNGSSTVHVSRNFKGKICKLYPVLVSGFRRTGASLVNFTEQLAVGEKKKVVKEKKDGFAKLAFGKFMKFLGLKKTKSSKKSTS